MHSFDSLLRPLSGTTQYYSFSALRDAGLGDVSRFPLSLKILLESLLRMQAHPAYETEHVTSFLKWKPGLTDKEEFPYMPVRVLFQDFTGVPCVVDLAALRSALHRAGQNPAKIEPQIQVDLVIDHSVQVDQYGDQPAYDYNLAKEFERNRERYRFLRWGQGAFRKLSVLPPGLGICHQVNMEYLASCVIASTDAAGRTIAYPDTLVGTDSHTTMINSMGVLGWGVGGIEAEAAMLGQPIPLLMPTVTGLRLTGELPEDATPTDVALAVTQVLRAKGVVGHFVEFFGPGLNSMSLADRAPIANMAPEYGATMGFFPIDDATLEYLRITGRSQDQINLVERYCKEQGLYRTPDMADPLFDQILEMDLSTIEPSLAGPKRPQDRVAVKNLKRTFSAALTEPQDKRGFALTENDLTRSAEVPGRGTLTHGSVVISAITSCTNTSNPSLLIGAGLLAKKAVEKGLTVPPYVKTSMAPGSRVVTEYLKNSGVLPYLEKLGYSVIAYGCTTCIGNSGPLPAEIETAIKDKNLVAAAVLSGNRNFEGRIHPLTQANYLCSPPLVVAYGLAGTVNIDLDHDPIGHDPKGQPVYLRDIWPTRQEINALLKEAANPALYRKLYADISGGPEWDKLSAATDAVFQWDDQSTYIREPTYFDDFAAQPEELTDIQNAVVLGYFGDFITTDHISPAGSIPKDSPAGQYLIQQGVQPVDFNSYGSRRGNHEIMIRGTFANIRIRNKLVERSGGWTVYHPSGETSFIYDAAMRYMASSTPSIVLAGKMYGAGSSRDWAAKGTYLLGVKAVIAESFERIHRSNLVEMGVLPLEFIDATAESLGLTGHETFSIAGIAQDLKPHKILTVTATAKEGLVQTFNVKCRIDSAIEVDYFRHGGILQYVLRDVMKS